MFSNDSDSTFEIAKQSVTASYQSGMTSKLMKNKYTSSTLKFKYITENGSNKL